MKLWVFVEGSSALELFSVSISEDEVVADLRHEIRRELEAQDRPKTFTFEKIVDDVPTEPPEDLQSRIAAAALEPLYPPRLIGQYWPAAPSLDSVHIYVVPTPMRKRSAEDPSNGAPSKRLRLDPLEATPPPTPIASMRSVPSLEDVLNAYIEEKCRSSFLEVLLQPDAPHYPAWKLPANSSEALKSHCCGMNIPSHHGMPSTLLYGVLSTDVVSAKALGFVCNTSRNVFLHGGSGTGKTAVALATQKAHWGLFTTCRVDCTPNNLGSADLYVALQRIKESEEFWLQLSALPSDSSRNVALTHNRRILRSHILPLLLSRLSILAEFLETASSRQIAIGEAHKTAWLKLQIFFMHIFGCDVFSNLSTTIAARNFPSVQLEKAIHDRLVTIHSHIPEDEALYIVVDEAQAAVEGTEDAFCSAGDSTLSRPLLTEVIRSLSEQLLSHCIIISGSKLSLSARDSALGSAVVRMEEFTTFEHLGVFSSPEEQKAYLEVFLPRTPDFEQIAPSFWKHLRGRYGFTSIAIEILLQTGFQWPRAVFLKIMQCVQGPGLTTPAPPLPTDELVRLNRFWERISPEVWFRGEKFSKVPTRRR